LNLWQNFLLNPGFQFPEKNWQDFIILARVYDKEEVGKRKNISLFKMEQELWMKVSGSIGDRLNIDVDYSDASGKKIFL
jgi:hypothetical protein